MAIGFPADVPCVVSIPTDSDAGTVDGGATETFTGTRGTATLANGSLRLHCANATTVIFDAVIRCFSDYGRDYGLYKLAKGDVAIHGQPLDRACQIAVAYPPDKIARGLLTCDEVPWTMNPVFHGHFSLHAP